MSNLVYLGGELWHADDIPDDVLMHYGVKGMKWGQRRNTRKIAKLESKINKTTDGLKANNMRLELVRRQLIASKQSGQSLHPNDEKLLRMLNRNRRANQIGAAGVGALAIGSAAYSMRPRR